MSEPISVDLDRGPDDGRRSFEHAPEVMRAEIVRANAGPWARSPEQKRTEPAKPAEEIGNPEADYYRAQLEQASEAVAEVREQVLDDLAWESNWDKIGTPAAVQIMDNLLAAGGGARMADALSEWQLRDPQGAAAWLADRQSRAVAARNQQAHIEAENLKSAQKDARNRVIADFITNAKNPVIAAQVSNAALTSEAPPEEIATALQGMYARALEAQRADALSFRDRQIKDAFSDPRTAGIGVLDPRTGEERPVVEREAPEVIQSRMRPSEEQQHAQSEQEVQDFRASFKAESKPRFGPGADPR